MPHLEVFPRWFGAGRTNQEALMMAVFPRLFAVLGVVAVAVALLIGKEPLWLERLRLIL
jgi:hypothetical protein